MFGRFWTIWVSSPTSPAAALKSKFKKRSNWIEMGFYDNLDFAIKSSSTMKSLYTFCLACFKAVYGPFFGENWEKIDFF